MLRLTGSFKTTLGILFLFLATRSEKVIAQPSFVNGATQSITVCQDSGPNDITANLSMNDLTSGSTETWTIISSTSGTLGGFSYSDISTGFVVTPIGLSYTPPPGFSGTDVFTIQVSDGTMADVTTITITVNPLPVVAAITGADTVCSGFSTAFSSATAGGAWSTSDAGIANITSTTATSSDIAGVSVGNAIITYSKTNSCGTTNITHALYVNDVPAVASVTGTSLLCVGANATFIDATTGGAWSSSNSSIATVDPTTGDVTGVSTGAANISYTITNSCGSNSVFASITVDDIPVVPAIGGATTICAGSTTTLTNATTGGTWSSDAAGVATINPTTGNMTGVSAGTANITYSVGNSCGTTDATIGVSISPLPETPSSITGAGPLCVGATRTFTNSVSGGAWSSDATSIATVDPGTGDVTGVSTGTANISYTITNSCGSNSVSASITVDDIPIVPAIGGTTSICAGATITLSNTATGGVWSSDAAGVATVDPSSGVVTGMVVGTANITYSISNGCGTGINSVAVTVNDIPAVADITGNTSVCVGADFTLSDATATGTWGTSDAGTASVSATGMVTGIAGGSAIITYSVSNGCGTAMDTALVTVNPLPSITPGATPSEVAGTTSTALTYSETGSPTGYDIAWDAAALSAGFANVPGGILSGSPLTIALPSGASVGTYNGTLTVTDGTCNSIGVPFQVMLTSSNAAPAFTGGASQPLTLCQEASATDITSLLQITDADVAQTETWTVTATAGHGILSGFPHVGISAGGVIAPSGLFYTPDAGYHGTDVFTIQISDGVDSTTTTINVTVNPSPVAGVIAGPATVCEGSMITLTDTASGGVWSSTNPLVAPVGVSGVVTG